MSKYWTNESVLSFAGERDPVEAVENAAQQLVFEAVERGWAGPPFDPFELARLRGIPVQARQELADARIVPIGGGKLRIDYNPTRPSQRLRFSVAHEIAHTLFADVADAARYRSKPGSGPPDAWQLELLCNIAAGELLMPTDTFPELHDEMPEMERLMALRRQYLVSIEALLRRVTKLSGKAVAMFAASRTEPHGAVSKFRIDYTVGSRAWTPSVRMGTLRPSASVLAECTAVGFTAKRRETWSPDLEEIGIQAVGAPPFPGHRYPRVLGLIFPRGVRRAPVNELQMLHGDATQPRGGAPIIIVHVVNDRTTNWGGPFSRALRERYPRAQDDFRDWARGGSDGFALGNVHISDAGKGVYVATMVAQRGYGPSVRSRLRYSALKECLAQVSQFAREHHATAHMPRIGTGQAGGSWTVIRELIDQTLTRPGVPVTIYVPPGQPVDVPADPQTALDLGI